MFPLVRTRNHPEGQTTEPMFTSPGLKSIRVEFSVASARPLVSTFPAVTFRRSLGRRRQDLLQRILKAVRRPSSSPSFALDQDQIDWDQWCPETNRLE